MSLEELKQLASGLLVSFAIADASEKSGWLPYRTVPLEQFFVDGDMDTFADRVDAHYQAHGMDIVRDIGSAMTTYDVDAEAKATLAEALKAHEHGLYRSCCRVLLPELERVLREDWLRNKHIPLSPKALITKVNQYELHDYILDKGGLVLFGKIFTHLFERFEHLDDPQNDTTPNRHGATHGWAIYSTEQHSLNTIICADYVFRIMTAFKERKGQPKRGGVG